MAAELSERPNPRRQGGGAGAAALGVDVVAAELPLVRRRVAVPARGARALVNAALRPGPRGWAALAPRGAVSCRVESSTRAHLTPSPSI